VTLATIAAPASAAVPVVIRIDSLPSTLPPNLAWPLRGVWRHGVTVP
jgi:hypothetical protein